MFFVFWLLLILIWSCLMVATVACNKGYKGWKWGWASVLVTPVLSAILVAGLPDRKQGAIYDDDIVKHFCIDKIKKAWTNLTRGQKHVIIFSFLALLS